MSCGRPVLLYSKVEANERGCREVLVRVSGGGTRLPFLKEQGSWWYVSVLRWPLSMNRVEYGTHRWRAAPGWQCRWGRAPRRTRRSRAPWRRRGRAAGVRAAPAAAGRAGRTAEGVRARWHAATRTGCRRPDSASTRTARGPPGAPPPARPPTRSTLAYAIWYRTAPSETTNTHTLAWENHTTRTKMQDPAAWDLEHTPLGQTVVAQSGSSSFPLVYRKTDYPGSPLNCPRGQQISSSTTTLQPQHSVTIASTHYTKN